MFFVKDGLPHDYVCEFTYTGTSAMTGTYNSTNQGCDQSFFLTWLTGEDYDPATTGFRLDFGSRSANPTRVAAASSMAFHWPGYSYTFFTSATETLSTSGKVKFLGLVLDGGCNSYECSWDSIELYDGSGTLVHTISASGFSGSTYSQRKNDWDVDPGAGVFAREVGPRDCEATYADQLTTSVYSATSGATLQVKATRDGSYFPLDIDLSQTLPAASTAACAACVPSISCITWNAFLDSRFVEVRSQIQITSNVIHDGIYFCDCPSGCTTIRQGKSDVWHLDVAL